LSGCSGGAPPDTGTAEADAPMAGAVFSPLRIVPIDDNVRNDTLLVQTTFDLGDGTFVMTASHVEADDRNGGLRLYRYRPLPDSNAAILHASAPAYDSWTMLPTFFRDPRDSAAWIVLANFGERQSWGQKVFRLDAKGFTDLGFLNVALPKHFAEEDGGPKLVGIGPGTRVEGDGEGLLFRFAVDKLHLFDDLSAREDGSGLDLVLPGGRITYRWNAAEGMVLHIDGSPRKEPSPTL